VNSLLVAVALLVLVFVALVVLKQRGTLGAASDEWPFYAKKPLTQPEQVLYHRLVAALPECIVLAQVQLSRVLGVKKGFKFNEWNNRINRMSLDYVVCLKDATVVAAVELDDKSHEKASRVEADAKKDKALSAAGITLLRWKVGALPDEASIRQIFTQANPLAQQPSIPVPSLVQSSDAVLVKR
jgi:very-short-patch-repair endonuclease